MTELKKCTQQTKDENCKDCNFKDMCEPETIAKNGDVSSEVDYE